MRKLLFVSFIVISICYPSSDCKSWWFKKTDNEILADTLRSTRPKKVEKGLDGFIEKRNYSAILQTRNHARRMIRAQRNKIIRSNRLNTDNIQKKLLPWIKIDKKASQFFQKKATRQDGKDNSLSIYHQ